MVCEEDIPEKSVIHGKKRQVLVVRVMLRGIGNDVVDIMSLLPHHTINGKTNRKQEFTDPQFTMPIKSQHISCGKRCIYLYSYSLFVIFYSLFARRMLDRLFFVFFLFFLKKNIQLAFVW